MSEYNIAPETMEKKLPSRVYYVFSPEDDTVLIAMGVKINGDTIRWFDTVKERIMLVGQIEEKDLNGQVVFRRSNQESGGTYTFIPLDLKVYEEKVKHQLIAGVTFEDEEQMLTSLEKTRESAW